MLACDIYSHTIIGCFDIGIPIKHTGRKKKNKKDTKIKLTQARIFFFVLNSDSFSFLETTK